MKPPLRVKRVLLSKAVIGMTTLGILLMCLSTLHVKFKEKNLRDYREEISKKLINALSSKNATEFFNVEKDTLVHIMPDLSKMMSRKTFLTVIVMTKAENSDWRRTIRETWGTWAEETESIVLFFMCYHELSDDLKQESLRYHDLIVDNCSNDMALSAVKTLRVLNWYQKYFGEESEFLIKTDDNMFINLPDIRNFTGSLHPSEILSGVIAGKLNEDDESRTPEFDNPYSPMFVPHELWEAEYYPEFLSPGFLIISPRVIPYVLDFCGNIPLFHLENVYLTGMLIRWTLRLDLIDIPNIYDEYSLSLDYELWWNSLLNDVTAFRCNNRWRMIKMFKSMMYLN